MQHHSLQRYNGHSVAIENGVYIDDFYSNGTNGDEAFEQVLIP